VGDRNRYANRILAFFVAISSSYLIALVPLHSHLINDYRLVELAAMTLFLNGPLLYCYVRAMTEPDFKLTLRDTIHSLPFLLLVVTSIITRSFTENTSDLNVLGGLEEEKMSYKPFIGVAHYVLLVFYMLLSLRCLRAYQRLVPERFSYLKGVNLNWLAILIGLCLLLSTGGLIVALARIFTDIEFWPRAIYSMSLMLTLYYLMAFKAITQPVIFNDAFITPLPVETGKGAEPQYETSSLTSDQALQYRDRLDRYMDEHKPYLNNELRIGDLSQQLDIPPNHLSQIVNQHTGKNFFEFINYYRVQEAQRLLSLDSESNQSITQIGLRAGFNSQSVFYKQFKQHAALTPTQYRKQYQA
jgi:AraC-like DNA-binding protein